MRMVVQLLSNSSTIKKDLEFVIEYSYFSTPLNQTNRYRKTEVANALEILENHQSYEM